MGEEAEEGGKTIAIQSLLAQRVLRAQPWLSALPRLTRSSHATVASTTFLLPGLSAPPRLTRSSRATVASTVFLFRGYPRLLVSRVLHAQLLLPRFSFSEKENSGSNGCA